MNSQSHPAEIYKLVLPAAKRKLVSAHVTLHSNRSMQHAGTPIMRTKTPCHVAMVYPPVVEFLHPYILLKKQLRPYSLGNNGLDSMAQHEPYRPYFL